MSEQQNNSTPDYDMTLKALWRNWAFSFGSIAAILAMSLFISKLWLPFIAFAEAFLLLTVQKSDILGVKRSCTLMLRCAMYTMLWTTVVMLAINILCTPWLVGRVITFEIYNDEIPFVTALVIFPIAAVMSAIYIIGGQGNSYCRDCRRRHGFYAGDSIIANLFFKEARYQLFILMMVSLTLTAVDYWYYFTRYINANLSPSDLFFFDYVPIALYLLSLFFIGGRYISMASLYKVIGDRTGLGQRAASTIVRFMIYCGNELLLRRDTEGLWDTPAQSVIPRTRKIGREEAMALFRKHYDIEGEHLKYLFSGAGFSTEAHVLHYAVFIDEEHRAMISIDPASEEWANAYMLDCDLHSGTIAPALAGELYRIHTITMAWKTYDRRGRRLYPIKNYRPTFRFCDLRDWTVDYDDLSWFDVAHNNEDRQFFHIRRIWQQITGFFSRSHTATD